MEDKQPSCTVLNKLRVQPPFVCAQSRRKRVGGILRADEISCPLLASMLAG